MSLAENIRFTELQQGFRLSTAPCTESGLYAHVRITFSLAGCSAIPRRLTGARQQNLKSGTLFGIAGLQFLQSKLHQSQLHHFATLDLGVAENGTRGM